MAGFIGFVWREYVWEGEAGFAVFNALVALVSLYCVGMFICVLAGIKFCDAVCLFVWVSVLAAMLVICFWERGEGFLAGCVGLVSRKCECEERFILPSFDAVLALVSLYCVGEFICVLVGKRFCDAVGLSVCVCVLAVLFVVSFWVRGEGFLAGCVGLVSCSCECDESIWAVFDALVALVSSSCVGVSTCVLVGKFFCVAVILSV
uniref:GH13568p n=1 Tax=Drosophila melanogaster TaxID=7227 RepID=A2VED7_DROME|nr:GH13568p [Drosophila melanogaster]